MANIRTGGMDIFHTNVCAFGFNKGTGKDLIANQGVLSALKGFSRQDQNHAIQSALRNAHRNSPSSNSGDMSLQSTVVLQGPNPMQS